MINNSDKKKKENNFYKKYHLSDKKRKNLNFYMRHIANPLSYPLFRLLIKTPVSAMQISFTVLILGLISPVLIAFGNKSYVLIGCLLLQLAVILDCVDGSVARYKHQKTQFKAFMGKYFDILFHDTSVPLVFMGIGINAYNNLGNILYMYIGIITFLLIILTNKSRSVKYDVIVTYVLPRKRYMLKERHIYSFKDLKSNNPIIKFGIGFLRFFNEFSHIFTLCLIFTLIGKLYYLLYFYLPFYAITFIIKIIIELREGFYKLIEKKAQ